MCHNYSRFYMGGGGGAKGAISEVKHELFTHIYKKELTYFKN